MEYWKRILTPKNTEEIKPNLFVQKIKGDSLMAKLDKSVRGHNDEIKSDKYRVIYPAYWNGKYDLKVLIFGAFPIKSLFIFLLVLFLAYSYRHDIKMIESMALELNENQTFYLEFCKAIVNSSNHEYYLNQICWNDDISKFKIEINDTPRLPMFNIKLDEN